jgi:hypothetical protein
MQESGGKTTSSEKLKSNDDHKSGRKQRRWTMTGMFSPEQPIAEFFSPTSPEPSSPTAELHCVAGEASIQHQRLLTQNNLHMMTRINAVVTDDIEFQIIMPSEFDIEWLAKFIEAEYFYKFDKVICCCVLTTESWEPLAFDLTVGKRLQQDSIVRVIDYTDGIFYFF